MYIIDSIKKLTRFERILWCGSVVMIVISFLLSQGQGVLSLVASLFGATALIFLAKGDVLGQVLSIIFGTIYAIISWQYRYYGEVITYLGMSVPAAVASTIAWIRNPYAKNEVRVRENKKTDMPILMCIAAVVTVVFYFILKRFGTSNLSWSTISIATSFMASGLTFIRSKYYALWYALNDVILIVLWILASADSLEFLPMVMCFGVFLVNDIYGYVQWSRMLKRQAETEGV